MAFYGAMPVVMLLALASVTPVADAEEIMREVRVEAAIPLSGNSMAVGFDSLWTTDLETKKLARIHPGDNSVTESPVDEISGVFSGIAVGEGAIWVPNAGRSMLCKIDPRTNQVIMKVSANLPERATGIAAGEGAVWAITGAQAIALKRYSAETGTEQASISLPSRGTGVIVAFGSVWITGTGNDELYRVDPATNEIAATIELRSSPRMLVAGEDSIWVFNEGDGTVQRVEGKSGKIVATIETGTVGAGTIDVGGGFVWVATRTVPIIQIDPRTNMVHGKFKMETSEYSAIRFAFGSLWVSGGAVRRIKPPE